MPCHEILANSGILSVPSATTSLQIRIVRSASIRPAPPLCSLTISRWRQRLELILLSLQRTRSSKWNSKLLRRRLDPCGKDRHRRKVESARSVTLLTAKSKTAKPRMVSISWAAPPWEGGTSGGGPSAASAQCVSIPRGFSIVWSTKSATRNEKYDSAKSKVQDFKWFTDVRGVPSLPRAFQVGLWRRKFRSGGAPK